MCNTSGVIVAKSGKGEGGGVGVSFNNFSKRGCKVIFIELK